MKVSELRTIIKKHSRADLERLTVELYKAIPKAKKDLPQLNYPVISHIHNKISDSEEFILLNEFSDNYISYDSSNGNKIREHIAEFEKKWHGTVILAKGDVIEPDYVDKTMQMN